MKDKLMFVATIWVLFLSLPVSAYIHRYNGFEEIRDQRRKVPYKKILSRI